MRTNRARFLPGRMREALSDRGMPTEHGFSPTYFPDVQTSDALQLDANTHFDDCRRTVSQLHHAVLSAAARVGVNIGDESRKLIEPGVRFPLYPSRWEMVLGVMPRSILPPATCFLGCVSRGSDC